MSVTAVIQDTPRIERGYFPHGAMQALKPVNFHLKLKLNHGKDTKPPAAGTEQKPPEPPAPAPVTPSDVKPPEPKPTPADKAEKRPPAKTKAKAKP